MANQPNQPDDELWDLLNRADAAMADLESANYSPEDDDDDDDDDFDEVPLDPDQFGAEPVIYRNYSNGYGRDVHQPAPQQPQWNSAEPTRKIPDLSQAQPRQTAPRNIPEEPEEEVPVSRPAPHAKPTQAQKAVQTAYPGPIHAYNADFARAQESKRAKLPKEGKVPGDEQIYSDPEPAPAPMKKQKKKHHFHFGCLIALLIPVVLIALIIGAVSHLIAPPRTDAPIGIRKPGTSSILLCGTDESGDRTDTMMILYVDSVNKECGLLSLPRDTYGQTDYGLEVKLNSAYGRNDGGEEGMKVLLDYVQDILGYRPDGYLLVDLNILWDLVDLMGGVDVDVPTTIDFDDVSMGFDVHLEPGMQHLNGEQVLGLVRFRYGYDNQDLGRVDAQKAFLKAAMAQWPTPKNFSKIPKVLDMFQERSLNSLSTPNYVWFAVNLLRCGLENLRTDTLPGYATYIGDQSYFVLDPEAVVDLVNEHYNPYQKNITLDDVNIHTEG